MLSRAQRRKLLSEPLEGRNRVAAVRSMTKTTQVTLAAGVGVSQHYISSIEKGQYGSAGLPVETARAIAGYFGCAIEEIFPAGQQAVSA